jgi:general secretion pathway protein J
MKRGFTLLEVIIATAVVGMIGVSIYGAVDRSFDLKEEVAAYSERYRQAYVAMDRMTREVSSAFVSNHVELSEPRIETVFLGEDDELRFTAFSNTVLRAGAHQGDQETIHYRLDKDPAGIETNGKCLIRWSAPRLLEDAEDQSKGRDRVVICGVDRLRFGYHAQREDDWSEDWKTTDSARESKDYGVGVEEVRKRLPDRVRIDITLIMPDGETKLFRTGTKIRLHKALNF